MKPIQLDLFGDGVSEVWLLKKKLQNHGGEKLYKKCRAVSCNADIPNKPHRHYCWEHKIEFAPIDTVQTLRVYGH